MTEKGFSQPGDSPTSTSLLLRVSARDEQAWQELVHLYAPLIGRWGHRFGLSEAAVADVTQEVFLTVMRALPKYQPQQGGFRSWLWSIARNKMIDRRRSPAKRSQAVGGSSFLRQMAEIEQIEEADLPLDEPNDPRGERELVRRGLEQVRVEFQEKTWNAFWRTAIDGLTPDAVANELGMTNASVRQAKSRILRRLREQLGDV